MLFVVWGYLPLCFGLCYGPKFFHLTPCLSWLLWKLKRWTDWVLGFFPVHILGCEVVICFLGFKYIWLLITTVFFFSSYIFLTCRLLNICLFFHLYLDVKHLTGNLTRTKLLTLPILFYVSALVRCIIYFSKEHNTLFSNWDRNWSAPWPLSHPHSLHRSTPWASASRSSPIPTISTSHLPSTTQLKCQSLAWPSASLFIALC